jgi:hypothetical protein
VSRKGAFAVSSLRGISVREARWPIVEVCIYPELTARDIDSAYDRLEEIAKRREPHAHWTDLTKVDPLSIPASHRKHFADRERRLYSVARNYLVADVRIVEHSIVRGLLTAFEWLAGEAPWPVRNVATEEEARAWLRTFDLLRS